MEGSLEVAALLPGPELFGEGRGGVLGAPALQQIVVHPRQTVPRLRRKRRKDLKLFTNKPSLY